MSPERRPAARWSHVASGRRVTSPRAEVAVVMRTKDRPRLLQRAIESVCAQSFSDWVLVIVNDGGAPEPVERLVAERSTTLAGRVLVLHVETSRGADRVINLGVRAADSEYVVLHDDDDTWHPEFLETMVGHLRACADDPRVGGVVCHTERVMERIDPEGIVELWRHPYNRWLDSISLWRLAQGNTFPPISFLFRRSALAVVGEHAEDLPLLGDWEFNLRFAAELEIDVVPRVLCGYHLRPDLDRASPDANTVIAEVDQHRRLTTRLRNELLRRDLRAGRFGLGAVMNLALATALPSVLEQAAHEAAPVVSVAQRLWHAQIDAMTRLRRAMKPLRDR